MISSNQFDQISEYNERLGALMPKIQMIAKRYAGDQTGAKADELEADMIYSIIERQDKDPQFLSSKNNDSYILHYARYIPWAYINKKILANKHEVEIDGVKHEQAADKLLSWDACSDLQRAEWALDLADALGDLSKRESQVIALVAHGYATGHIAEMMGVSSPAICSYRNRAIKKLQAAVL